MAYALNPQPKRVVYNGNTILDAPPDFAPPRQPVPAPRPIQHGFVFEHVAFTYPGSPPGTRPVLRDVSFHLPPDAAIALVAKKSSTDYCYETF